MKFAYALTPFLQARLDLTIASATGFDTFIGCFTGG
jgi:hypothetical protein